MEPKDQLVQSGQRVPTAPTERQGLKDQWALTVLKVQRVQSGQRALMALTERKVRLGCKVQSANLEVSTSKTRTACYSEGSPITP